ncbi:MAG: TatD family hydrolase [Sphingobacterium sp.]
MLINIHTHHPREPDDDSFSLPNFIVSKDDFLRTPYSAGIHPWYIADHVEQQLQILEEHLHRQEVLAVGECGLDKVTSTPWDQQTFTFETQIQLANKYNKPIIVHCVRAFAEVCTLLKRNRASVPVLFHGYAKSVALAQTLLNQGYYLSLGASILGGKQDELIQHIPLERVFLETDDQQTKISEIYAYFCRSRKIPMRHLEEQILLNLKKVFNYSV